VAYSYFQVGGSRLENRQVVCIGAGASHCVVGLSTEGENEKDEGVEKQRKGDTKEVQNGVGDPAQSPNPNPNPDNNSGGGPDAMEI
jgi:hypothetical protein